MDRLLEIDKEILRDTFNQRPFRLRHRLEDHSLFSLERLLDLSKRLTEECVEYNAGDVPIGLDPSLTPRTGLSVQESIRRIEECRSWIVLKNVEKDPEYRALLDRCLDEVGDLSQGFLGTMQERVGFIFISSPESVTPLHIDPEHNFLLQVRGSKSIRICDRSDQSVISEGDLERYFSGGHRNLTCGEERLREASEFHLRPGDGVHVPFTAPHWVKNGRDVSVSFSITFHTSWSRRRGIVYKVNAYLRRSGFHPAPPGRSSLADSAKYYGFQALRQAKRLLSWQTAW